VDDGRMKRVKGVFKLRNKGKITFRNQAGRVVQKGTVLERVKTKSELEPFRPGIWLILSGRKGKRPDGNLLTLVR
jgi:hypothetical protein